MTPPLGSRTVPERLPPTWASIVLIEVAIKANVRMMKRTERG
jgi:hypothetical protein